MFKYKSPLCSYRLLSPITWTISLTNHLLFGITAVRNLTNQLLWDDDEMDRCLRIDVVKCNTLHASHKQHFSVRITQHQTSPITLQLQHKKTRTDLVGARTHYCKIYNVPQKKHPGHYRLSLKEMSTNFNKFRYKYFWHNWPPNDQPIYHLTQCLHLHDLGKNEPKKYVLK